jgi:hypothetical protein
MSDTKQNVLLIGTEQDLTTFCNSPITSNKEMHIESIGTVYAIRNNAEMKNEMNSLLLYISKEHKDIYISCIILLVNEINYKDVTFVLNCFEKAFGMKAEAVVCLIDVISGEKVNEVKRIVKDIVVWNGNISKELIALIKAKSTQVSDLSRLTEKIKKSSENKSKTTSRHVILKHKSKASLMDGLIMEVLNLWQYNLLGWSNFIYFISCICFISWILCFCLICKHCWKYEASFECVIYFVLWLYSPCIFAIGYSICIPRLLEDKVTSVVTVKNSLGFTKLKVLQTNTYLVKGELSEINHCDVLSEGNKISLKSSVKVGWLAFYNIEYDLRYKINEES